MRIYSIALPSVHFSQGNGKTQAPIPRQDQRRQQIVGQKAQLPNGSRK